MLGLGMLSTNIDIQPHSYKHSKAREWNGMLWWKVKETPYFLIANAAGSRVGVRRHTHI